MLQNKSFVKKTKKGKVLKVSNILEYIPSTPITTVFSNLPCHQPTDQIFSPLSLPKNKQVVREHYLRDDIYSGSPLDAQCDPESHKLSPEAPHYLVIDTNIALHQMDLLEHPSVADAIVTSVVLEEVRARNSSVYQRLRALISSPTKRFYVFANEHHKETYITADAGESPNDRNDRAIRVAAAWYVARLPTMRIILLTDDANNRLKAKEMGVEALSAREYARLKSEQVPDLVDLVAAAAAEHHLAEKESKEAGEKGGEGGSSSKQSAGKQQNRTGKRQKVYDDHKPMSEINAGLKAGRYHQGTLRVNRFNPFEGWVGSESVGEDILIRGRVDMNRAMEGDVVAIELLPEEAWGAPSSRLPSSAAGDAAGDGDDEYNDEENMEPVRVAQVDPGEHYGGSEAAALLLDGNSKRPTAKVIGIIKRNWRSRGYCGSLQPPRTGAPQFVNDRTTSVLFTPVERKFPFIRIQTRQAQTLSDKRIVVAIDGWEADSMYPTGHYVRNLGNIGDKDVETEVLLIENDINTAPFSPAVHACVPPLPWKVTEEDINDPHRADLRHLPICSVDPPGCKDIDDALHIRRLENGNWELGVHIADVTHFLHPGTAMDVEAASRATTTYLVQRRIDMLPKPLTEDICSLRADVERLAFSVMWEITDDTAEIINSKFTKSVIRSRAALTYQEAQSRIDDSRLSDEISENLRQMNRIAKIMRQRRTDRGALSLASPEVKFEIDTETHDPLDVGMYQLRETNQMVEEMMLLANCTVAERCLSSFPACSLLRRHPTPPPRQFEPLMRAAAAVGLTINATTSKMLAESLDLAVRSDDPYFNKLIRIMATRCMTQAVYLNSGEMSVPEYYHYGLAAPLYTHFTSPIRRYADVVVHRVLMAALGLKPLPESVRDRAAMHPVVGNLNVRHRNAQLAGRASVELHTLIFFKDRQILADARVTRVKSNGLIVFVPKFGIEGPVFLSAIDSGSGGGSGGSGSGVNSKKLKTGAPTTEDVPMSDGAFHFDEEKQIVSNASGSLRYTIFDACAVKIFVQEGTGRRRTLVLELVPREELPESEKMTSG
jgi:exosome complex exonuclease DIS3/RRP44